MTNTKEDLPSCHSDNTTTSSSSSSNNNSVSSTMVGHELFDFYDGDDSERDEHTILRKHPYLWAAVGILHTVSDDYLFVSLRVSLFAVILFCSFANFRIRLAYSF